MVMKIGAISGLFTEKIVLKRSKSWTFANHDDYFNDSYFELQSTCVEANAP